MALVVTHSRWCGTKVSSTDSMRRAAPRRPGRQPTLQGEKPCLTVAGARSRCRASSHPGLHCPSVLAGCLLPISLSQQFAMPEMALQSPGSLQSIGLKRCRCSSNIQALSTRLPAREGPQFRARSGVILTRQKRLRKSRKPAVRPFIVAISPPRLQLLREQRVAISPRTILRLMNATGSSRLVLITKTTVSMKYHPMVKGLVRKWRLACSSISMPLNTPAFRPSESTCKWKP